MRLLTTWLVATGLFLTAVTAHSATVPYSNHRNLAIKSKMYVDTYVNIGANHFAKIDVKFSNGKRIEGGTFDAIITLLDAGNQPITQPMEFQQEMGPAGFHGGTERTIHHSLALSPDQVARLAYVDVKPSLLAPTHYGVAILAGALFILGGGEHKTPFPSIDGYNPEVH